MQNMLLKNSHLWVDASIRMRYAGAAMMLVVAFVLRSWCDSWLAPYLPTQFFLLCSLLTALWFGYVPALVSLVAGWLAGIYYFVEPYGQFSPANIYDVIVTVNDLAAGVVGIAVIEYLQRTRYSNRLMLQVSESRYRSLLRLDNQRVHQQRLSNRALRQVNDIFAHMDRVLLIINRERQVYPQAAFLEKYAMPTDASQWLERVHPEDRPTVERNLASVMEGGREQCDVNFRILTHQQVVLNADCVFRALPLSAQHYVFALMLKAR